MASVTITVADSAVPTIVAALRAGFPGETAGLADGPAAKAAVIAWLTDFVAQYQATQSTTINFTKVVNNNKTAVSGNLS